MKYLVCLLEEPSAKEMLEGLLPRIIPSNVYVKYIVFEGKQDLEKQVERKMKLWRQPDSVFLIMRDQDAGNCIDIKKNLLAKVNTTGKKDVTVIRIACHELESFYIGDLAAVEYGLEIEGLSNLMAKRKFRIPDNLTNAVEELSKVTKGSYQKVAGSRNIGPHLKVDGTNKSHSFNVLIEGIKKVIGTEWDNLTEQRVPLGSD